MPAPAVIPAPIAYIKFVAVKKLVVGFLQDIGVLWPLGSMMHRFLHNVLSFVSFLNWMVTRDEPITLNKLECLKQAIRLP